MPADALKCKECGTTYDARGALRLRAVLRPARGRLRLQRPRRRRAPAPASRPGRADIWRYADFLPVRQRAARAPALDAGLHAADPRRPARRARSGCGELWVKNDAANPTHSFKDRVVAVAPARARELGFEVARVRLDRATSPTRSPRTPRRRGPRVLRLHPGRPRGAEDPRHRRLRHQPRRRARQLRRRQPAVHRARRRARPGRSSTSTCAPTTPRAPRRSPTRSPSSSAASCPTASSRPIASGSLFTKIARGLRGVDRGRPDRRRGADDATAPRPRAARRSRRRSRTATTSAARSSPTRSPSRWRSATRPTAPTRSTSRAAPAARSTRSPTTRSARASACSPRRPASSPRRPAA